MRIHDLIAQLQAAEEELGQDAVVQIEQVFDREQDDSYGLVFGLAIGTHTDHCGEVAEREQAPGYEQGVTRASRRIQELDRYQDLGYLG